MTLKQMRYFLRVTKTLNLTQAASELFISQPTLSLSMKELEQEIGVPLFEKKSNRLILTDAGAALQDELSQIILSCDRLDERIRSGSLQQDYLRFGFSTVVGNTIAAKLVKKFKSDHPETQLIFTEDFGENMLRQLENGSLDVVITNSLYAERAEWKGKFSMRPLYQSGMLYYVSKEHPFAKIKNATLADLAACPSIMLNSNFPLAQRIEQIFAARGLSMNIILRTSQLYTIEQFVSAGVGGGFLTPEFIHSTTGLVQVECPGLEEVQLIPTSIYWKKDVPPSSALQKLLKITDEMFTR